MNELNTIWAEKYRPKDLDTYIGNEFMVSKFREFIENQDVPNILLASKSPGTGKTSAAKMLAASVDCDLMYINAADENGVETIRDKIKGFASTIGFRKWKFVILDECLTGDTLVSVLRNSKELLVPLETVDDKNDLVKSYNIKTNKVEWMPFYFWNTGKQDIWEVELENGELIKCTGSHKWYVYDENNEIKVVTTEELHFYNHILSPL